MATTRLTTLLNERDSLRAQLDEALSPSRLSERALQAVLRSKIKWYDYEELKGQAKSEYIATAHNLLQNEVLQNEVAGVIADLTEAIVSIEGEIDWKEKQRYAILGIQAVMEHLDAIQ